MSPCDARQRDPIAFLLDKLNRVSEWLFSLCTRVSNRTIPTHSQPATTILNMSSTQSASQRRQQKDQGHKYTTTWIRQTHRKSSFAEIYVEPQARKCALCFVNGIVWTRCSTRSASTSSSAAAAPPSNVVHKNEISLRRKKNFWVDNQQLFHSFVRLSCPVPSRPPPPPPYHSIRFDPVTVRHTTLFLLRLQFLSFALLRIDEHEFANLQESIEFPGN